MSQRHNGSERAIKDSETAYRTPKAIERGNFWGENCLNEDGLPIHHVRVVEADWGAQTEDDASRIRDQCIADGTPTPSYIEPATVQGVPIEAQNPRRRRQVQQTQTRLTLDDHAFTAENCNEDEVGCRQLHECWPGGKPKVLMSQGYGKLLENAKERSADQTAIGRLKAQRDCWLAKQSAREVYMPPSLPPLSGELGCTLPPVCRVGDESIRSVTPCVCKECSTPRCLSLRPWRSCSGKRPEAPPPQISIRHFRRRRQDCCRGRCTSRTCCVGGKCQPADRGVPCRCNVGDQLGTSLGDCFRQAPPPWPIPVSPLGFATCWDKNAIAEREAQSKRPFYNNFCSSSPQKAPPTTGGGFRALCKDALGLAVLATAEATGVLAHCVGCVLPKHDEVAYPDPLYPNPIDGQYPDRPPQPTRPTGLRWIDKTNRFLDELLVERPPHPQYKDLTPKPGLTKTVKTGNICVDAINDVLDNICTPPSAEPTVEEKLTLPRSSFKQSVRCIFHCRDQCKFQRWDCAGLKYQRVFTDPDCGLPPTPSLLEKICSCISPAGGVAYKEKLGEAWMPSLYGREKYYCPHCDRNRFTGKRRCRIEAPKFQFPIQLEQNEATDTSDCVDFSLA